MVSPRVPTHQLAVAGVSLRSRFVTALRLDATDPLLETVAALNGFQPRLLLGYPSVLRPVPAEQRAGRLQIAPQSVLSALTSAGVVSTEVSVQTVGAVERTLG